MKMFLQGEFVDSASGQTYSIHNPATGELVDEVPLGGREDVKRAVDAAQDSFEAWSDKPIAERAKLLLSLAEQVRENAKGLAATLTKEQGKPVGESIAEVNSFANTCEYYAGLAGKVVGRFNPFSSASGYFVVLKKPVGVCGAILPWNFPVSLLGWKIAPGLVAGNTFVVKPASTTPLTELEIARLIKQAGFPDGVLNVVTGPGSTVGQEIVENPGIRKIAFTGETETGKQIMAACARSVKRVTLELGGSDPMIVCDDADIDLAAEAAAWGRFRNCGQSCTSVKRLFVFDGIAQDFLNKFIRIVKEIRVGNGLSPETHVGPVHTEAQRQKVEEMVKDSLDRRAKLLVGGERPQGEEYQKGFFYLPTVLTDVDYDARIAREECFGPAIPVFIVKDLEEAIERANDSVYGLGSSIWTRDLNRAATAAERLQAGTTWINSPPIARPEVPFGGFKQSGFGRELGLEGLDHYFEVKAVQYDLSGRNKTWRFPITAP